MESTPTPPPSPPQEPPPVGRFQFSLRDLMLMVAAVALLLGMWNWRGERGLLEYFLGASVCLILAGIYRRRVVLIVAGVVALIGIQVGVRFSSRRTAARVSTVTASCLTTVQVLDARNDKPISNAWVRFSANTNWLPAGSQGITRFPAQYTCIVEECDWLLGTWTSRWIALGGEEISAEADGYRSETVSLRKQFGDRLDDRSALPLITVRLSPQAQGK